jgi:hypothetical protein
LAADHGQIFQTFGLMIRSRSSAIWGEDHDPVIAKQNFIKMPYPLVVRLAENAKYPALAVLSELIWESFTSGKNPIRYSSDRLTRYVKRRGLAILKREGWITVEQKRGKAPVVTLRWLKTNLGRISPQPGPNRTKTWAESDQNLG